MANPSKPRRDIHPRPHPHLFEINAWAWLDELSRAKGRRISLGQVADEEWDKLAEQGFDLIWLMGIWKRSPESRRFFQINPPSFSEFDAALPGWQLEDVTGSPYSVRAYEPDPRLGTWDDLDSVREKLRDRGLGLILDFVCNHTALDHPWTRARPEFYVQGRFEDYRQDPAAFFPVELENGRYAFLARARDPYFPPWPDVAQLNYFHAGAREAILAEVRSLAQHCDGVRCDMAMLVLNDIFVQTWGSLLGGLTPPREEFWSQAIAAVPKFVWIAEVYWDLEWRLQQLGFSFTYDKRLYDRLRGGPPAAVRAHLAADAGYQAKLVRFLENHDEPRAATVFGADRLPAVGTLFATLPGMRLYHQGQLEGRTKHLPIALARGATEAADAATLAFYERVLRITNEEIFHAGEWRLIEVQSAGDASDDALIAYRWRSRQGLKLVVLNLAASPSQGLIPLPEEIDAAKFYVFSDELSGIDCRWAGKDLATGGLYVRLAGFQAHLFSVTPDAPPPAPKPKK